MTTTCVPRCVTPPSTSHPDSAAVLVLVLIGLLHEGQFRRLYEEATRRPGITGHNLLRFLELRVDNVVFRTGWARTRPQARQFVSHGVLTVNGRKVTIPSLRLRAGDWSLPGIGPGR